MLVNASIGLNQTQAGTIDRIIRTNPLILMGEAQVDAAPVIAAAGITTLDEIVKYVEIIKGITKDITNYVSRTLYALSINGKVSKIHYQTDVVRGILKLTITLDETK